MTPGGIDESLHALSDILVKELIAITPRTMSEIQFEIVSTEDGGADIGLLETHPAVPWVALSDTVYDLCSRYLPLVKKHVPGWQRSLITLRETGAEWQASVKFERR